MARLGALGDLLVRVRVRVRVRVGVGVGVRVGVRARLRARVRARVRARFRARVSTIVSMSYEGSTPAGEVNSNMMVSRLRMPMLFDLHCSCMVSTRVCTSMKCPRLRSFHQPSIAARITPVFRPRCKCSCAV